MTGVANLPHGLPAWLPADADDWILEKPNGDLDVTLEGASAAILVEASDPNHCPRARKLVMDAAGQLPRRERDRIIKIIYRGRAPGSMELARAGMRLAEHLTLEQISEAW